MIKQILKVSIIRLKQTILDHLKQILKRLSGDIKAQQYDSTISFGDTVVKRKFLYSQFGIYQSYLCAQEFLPFMTETQANISILGRKRAPQTIVEPSRDMRGLEFCVKTPLKR